MYASDDASRLGRAGYQRKMALYAKVAAMGGDDDDDEEEEVARVVQTASRKRPTRQVPLRGTPRETAAAKRAKTVEEAAAQKKLSELHGRMQAAEEEREREAAEYSQKETEFKQARDRLQQELKEVSAGKDTAITEMKREVDGLRRTLQEDQETQRREEAKRAVADAENKLTEFKKAHEEKDAALQAQAAAFKVEEGKQLAELAALQKKIDDDAVVSSRAQLMCALITVRLLVALST